MNAAWHEGYERAKRWTIPIPSIPAAGGNGHVLMVKMGYKHIPLN